MDKFFLVAAMISMAGVVVSLLLGLGAMTKVTQKAHRLSNKLMQMRVFFQGLAIAFLVLAYFTKQ